MRILQVVNSLSAGGAESLVVSLACAQASLRQEVTVFSYAGVLDSKGDMLEQRLARSGVEHVTANARTPRRKVGVPLALNRYWKKLRPDVVHSHMEQSDFFVSIASLLTGARVPPLVRTVHNVHATRALPVSIHRWLAQRFIRTVACGASVGERYPYFGAAGPTVIENGIELDAQVAVDRAALRQQLGIDAGDAVGVSIGSFNRRHGVLQKGQDVLVDAMARMSGDGLRMIFLGEGECRQDIVKRARQSGVGHRCTFAGQVPNPMDYIHASDFVAMPSRFEGLSIAAIEAACVGRPLILSDIDAFALFRGPAVRFVPLEDPLALSAALEEFKRQRSSFQIAAQASAETYRRRFDIVEVARRYLSLYEAL